MFLYIVCAQVCLGSKLQFFSDIGFIDSVCLDKTIFPIM